METDIVLKGCRTHNLKNIDLKIPLRKITALLGVSGAGKSSLAFDTLYAEGYLRYIESISPHIRQFLDRMEGPQLDSLEHLPPALACRIQKTMPDSRSIVAMAAGIYDYLRVLYAKIAVFHCPGCKRLIRAYSVDEMTSKVLALGDATVSICFAYAGEIAFLVNRGYLEYVEQGKRKRISAEMQKKKMHVLLDEVEIKPENRGRIFEALEQSLSFGGKTAILYHGHRAVDIPASLFCPECQKEYAAADENLFSFRNPRGACRACRGSGYASARKACPQCRGKRLNPLALAFRVKGRSFSDFLDLTVEEALHFLQEIDPAKHSSCVSPEVFAEIDARLGYLKASRLQYLELNRPLAALSRGEYGQIRMAFILGSTISDSLMVLDQPFAGLHTRDFPWINRFLQNLKSNGNTVILLDHHPEILKVADFIVELGPQSAKFGGEVVFSGTCRRFVAGKKTLTQKCFRTPPAKPVVPRVFDSWLEYRNASTHNLKGFYFRFPCHALTVVTGVSASGKTTLLYHEIFAAERRSRRMAPLFFFDPREGSIRKTMNVAGFLHIAPFLRTHLAGLLESRLFHFLPNHFSNLSPLGRCLECAGNGYREMDMHFLPTVKVRCQICDGSGIIPDVLKVKTRGMNIAQILHLTVQEFAEMFAGDIPRVSPLLDSLMEMGLGSIEIGQRLEDLSTGELQKVRLCEFFLRSANGRLILIDDPFSGLHLQEVRMIGRLLLQRVEKGCTLVLAGLHPGLLEIADYVLELGPVGGPAGGHLLFQGPAADFGRERLRKKNKKSEGY